MPVDTSHPPAPGPRAVASSRFRRRSDDRIVVGVCAGIADVFGAPALLVRAIALAVLIALPPFALIAYAGLAVAVPRDDGRALLGGQPADGRETFFGWTLIAAALISVGVGVEATSLIGGTGWLVLLGAGIVLLVVQHQRHREHPTAALAYAPSPTGTTQRTLEMPYPGPAATAPSGSPAGPRGPRERSIALYGFAAIVGAATLATILHAAGAFEVSGRGLAIGFGAGALALTIGAVAFATRRGAGTLVVLAVLLTFAALGAAAVGDNFEDGVGDRNEFLATPADLSREYRFGTGSFTLNVSREALPPGVSTLRATLGIGELNVNVPPGVRVVSVGATSLTDASFVNQQAGADAKRTLRIDADVDHGSADVSVIDQ
jgi:phage shock protein PspC (stress-responsive transcriptional regulator)